MLTRIGQKQDVYVFNLSSFLYGFVDTWAKELTDISIVLVLVKKTDKLLFFSLK